MASNGGFILGMLAEASLHPGSGQAADVVDLPVSREGATGIPQVPETSLKGALRQWAESSRQDGEKRFDRATIHRLFGTAEADGSSDSQGAHSNGNFGAGELLISTARLICLPVRQLDGLYAWVTCPFLLDRFQRDCTRCGLPAKFDIPEFEDGPSGEAPSEPTLLVNGNGQTHVYLEEYVFKQRPLKNQQLVEAIKPLLGISDHAKNRLMRKLAVMSDTEFSWFAQNALPVDARNVLDEDTKMSKNLWFEETLPPDTLMYSVILSRTTEGEKRQELTDRQGRFKQALQEDGYLQVGGNETVGQGWVSLALHGA